MPRADSAKRVRVVQKGSRERGRETGQEEKKRPRRSRTRGTDTTTIMVIAGVAVSLLLLLVIVATHYAKRPPPKRTSGPSVVYIKAPAPLQTAPKKTTKKTTRKKRTRKKRVRETEAEPTVVGKSRTTEEPERAETANETPSDMEFKNRPVPTYLRKSIRE